MSVSDHTFLTFLISYIFDKDMVIVDNAFAYMLIGKKNTISMFYQKLWVLLTITNGHFTPFYSNSRRCPIDQINGMRNSINSWILRVSRLQSQVVGDPLWEQGIKKGHSGTQYANILTKINMKHHKTFFLDIYKTVGGIHSDTRHSHATRKFIFQ